MEAQILLGFKGKSYASPDYYASQILASVLGGGMSSRLFQKIREEMGAAYSVYTYPTSYPGCGVYAIYAGTSIEQAQAVIDEIQHQVKLFLDKGFTDKEFVQARDQLKGGYILGLESTSSRMSSIGRSKLLLGYANEIDTVVEKIERVTREEVMEIARKVLEGPYAAAAVGRKVDTLHLQ